MVGPHITEPDARLRARILDSVGELLARVLGREVQAVSESTPLRADMTSATILELLLELEDALGVRVDVEDLDEDDTATLGALADFVVAHSQAAE
jgi:acyl carrier protein